MFIGTLVVIGLVVGGEADGQTVATELGRESKDIRKPLGANNNAAATSPDLPATSSRPTPSSVTASSVTASNEQPANTGNSLLSDAVGYESTRLPDFKLKYGTPFADDAIHKMARFTRYVDGALQGYEVACLTSNVGMRYDCPSGVTMGQVYAVVAKYLKEHPEKLHQPSAMLVIDALAESFPPKK
jgi:hypothetical protein